jgi:hypothetical protein
VHISLAKMIRNITSEVGSKKRYGHIVSGLLVYFRCQVYWRCLSFLLVVDKSPSQLIIRHQTAKPVLSHIFEGMQNVPHIHPVDIVD